MMFLNVRGVVHFSGTRVSSLFKHFKPVFRRLIMQPAGCRSPELGHVLLVEAADTTRPINVPKIDETPKQQPLR